MASNKKQKRILLAALFFISLWGLTPTSLKAVAQQPENRFEVGLYTGIPGIVQLGDSYRTITENTQIPFSPIDITEEPQLLKAGIVYGISFEPIGTKIYFKRSGSCLISLTPPFAGSVKTTQIQIFNMAKPANLKWEEFLFKELGQPNFQGGGGLFEGDVYYYPWGDIEVSRIGLRQLTLYRDNAIAEYRKNNSSASRIKFFK